MGKVVVKVKLINQFDLFANTRMGVKRKPREVEVGTLVDTGATRLYLKTSVIRALSLEKVGEVASQTTHGTGTRAVYDPVRLELMERHGIFEVVGMDEHVPNLLGQIPLAYLDLVVNPQGRELIPNPEHGEKQMTEAY